MIARLLFAGIACALMLGAMAALAGHGTGPATIAWPPEVSYEDARAFMEANSGHSAEGWTYFVDVRPAPEFDRGHIQDSVNLPYDALCSGASVPTKAIARAASESIAPGYPIVVYGEASDPRAPAMAETLLELDYDRVYVYAGGIHDWREVHDDYLCMGIDSFIAWHAAHFPFVGGDSFLIDVNPKSWYLGEEVLEGHIPGAISIQPEEVLFRRDDGRLALLDAGTALASAVGNPSAEIVIYNAGRVCPRSADMIWAALQLGYTRVYRLERGIDRWLANGGSLDAL